MSSKRYSNIELIRIVLTLMIITLHYFNKNMGGVIENLTLQDTNYYIAQAITSICIISVNVFIIITGFFLCDKNSIKIRKVVNLYVIAFFYNLVFEVIYIIINKVNISINVILDFVKQNIDGAIWFVIIYGILYLLIPYINKLINNITKRELQILIIIGVIFFSIWPTFISNVTVKDSGYGIINFITLYLIGSYIKKYLDTNIKIGKCWAIFIICTITTFIIGIFAQRAFIYNSIFNIIASTCFFLIFKDLKIDSKVINKLSRYTFGIYIIHTNPYVSEWLWEKVFLTQEFCDSNNMIFHMIFAVAGVYCICLLIDIVRTNIFKYTVDILGNKIKILNKEIRVE